MNTQSYNSSQTDLDDQSEIKTLNLSDSSLWDDYVKSHPQGSFFHLSGWQQVIDRSFAHPCYFLFSRYISGDKKGQINGVLPLVEVKSKLFGHALISNTILCLWRSYC